MDNICRFFPAVKIDDPIHVVNLVLETKKRIISQIISYYRINYVVSGKGELIAPGVKKEINAGDIFFIFPGEEVSITSIDELKYIYIGFMGKRASNMLDSFEITTVNCVYSNIETTARAWEKLFSKNSDITDLKCESMILDIISKIGEICSLKNLAPKENIAHEVKKYIDENFWRQGLSLENITAKFPYNKKYISSVFKSEFKTVITKYITTLRIQHACFLIEQGYTSISDIASRCGYSDALYFSKIFKNHLDISPKKYITELNHNK